MRSKSILLWMAILFLAPTTNADVLYNITSLGNLSGGHGAQAYCINNNGQIVGYGYPASGPISAILFGYISGGENIRLCDTYSCARAINDSGQIVGYGYQGAGSIKPLLFDPSGNGNNTILGSFSSEYGGRAYAINNSGQIVGGSGNGEECSAWLFDITGHENNLYLGQGAAVSISDNGLIVGSSHPIASEGWHATLFDPTGNGNNIDLGKLFSEDDRSFASSINNCGQIVGDSGGPGQGYTATLYDGSGNGSNIALGAIGNSYANCINNYGQIVGSEYGHATLFNTTDGGNTNLNDLIEPTLGWTLYRANFINDEGWIVGLGNNGAYLLAPIPEPSTIIDIKPGSCPNPLNVKSRGVLPVAILGSEDFDVNSIDIASIRLAGVAPIRSSYEDVTTPVSDANECECSTEGPDGFLDLTLKFETQMIVEAIGGVNHGDELVLELTGVLSDETAIEGTDCVIIRGKHKPLNKADFNGDGIVDMADFAAFAETWLQ